MSKFRIRIAKKSDFREIANIHYLSRESLNSGFFSLATRRFIYLYYKIMLDDPNFVVLCVEDETSKINGFVSASLDAKKQFKNLSNHKFSLGFSLIPLLFFRPHLLFEAIKRYKSSLGKSNERFVNIDGVRGEFWVWDIRKKNSVWAVILYNSHLNLLSLLGIEKMNFEVDKKNRKILKFHKNNGAKILDNYSLPDGRERLLMCYYLKNLKNS
tara:strand:+ start:860 stop:1498 length:639 start_codon:yes stop_codon:yes gene_type:complete